MAGIKYICMDCNFTARMPNRTACKQCGSENIKTAAQASLKKRTCKACERIFMPVRPGQKVCDTDECKKVARNNREKAIRDKNREKSKCVYCGNEFVKRNRIQTVCLRPECRKKRDDARRAQVKESVKRRELLGPSKPLMPMRKCHTPGCSNMSYNCWCPKCQGRRALNHDIEGRSAMSDLFSGGHINVEVAY